MDEKDLKQRLARLLFEKSYLEGDFILSSGRKSDYYFDCRQTSLYPEGAWLIGHLFVGLLGGMDIQGVGGMTLGADPLISATSLAARERGFNWPGLIVRKKAKEHGTGRAVEGLKNFSSGANIAMLEDVVSTGGSVLKACDSVLDSGLHVSAILCVLDRQEGGKEEIEQAGYKLISIFTRAELLKHAR